MLNQQQYRILNKLNTWRMSQESVIITEEIKSLEWNDLSEIKWVWPNTVKELHQSWIKNSEQLKQLTEDEIKWIVTNPISLKAILNYIKQ